MAAKNPFDYSEMFKVFDPEDVAKMFNPKTMFSAFEMDKTPAPFDMTKLFDTNRKNFEAMVEANKSAAAAYKDLLEKQMDVFGQLTAAARDHMAWVDEAAGPEALSKKTEAYGEAVEKALGLMKKLADSARDANEEAYAKLKGQINETIDQMRKKTGK